MAFYSFVIPARNEGDYLKNTLSHIKSLNFPKEKYEAIVVESGSTDDTFKIAKKFASKTIKAYHIKIKGVSNARNFGALKTSKKSDWIIFLDADTIVKKNFLKYLDALLAKNPDKYSYGAFKVHALEKNRKSIIFFFKLYNIFMKFRHISYAIQAIKREYLLKNKNVRYDSNLTVGEDYQILKEVSKYGKYFFLNSNEVETSIRRFEKLGIFHVYWTWILGALLPRRLKTKLNYKVIR
jgi:glycosyltransferase involved in cell wall biosynthesis